MPPVETKRAVEGMVQPPKTGAPAYTLPSGFRPVL
jgi:hypothetical protein